MSTQLQNESLLEHAFDLTSCGLGTQRAVVSALLGDEVRDRPYVAKETTQGVGSNMLCTPTWSEARFGDRLQDFEARYHLLEKHWAGLHRRCLRIVLGGDVARGNKDIELEEFRGLMGKLAEPPAIGDGAFHELFENRNDPFEFYQILRKVGVPQERRTWYLAQIKETLLSSELSRDLLKFHARKLKLMADLLSCNFDTWGANPAIRPSDPSGSWSRNWENLFDEPLPTAEDLIATSLTLFERAAIALRGA